MTCNCSKNDAFAFIQKMMGDCDKAVWTDEHLDFVWCMAVKALVRHNKSSFQRTKSFTLKNGVCIQDACPECSDGVIGIAGNVNGGCDAIDVVETDEDKEQNERDSWMGGIYGDCGGDADNESDDYVITSFERLGDGSCGFKVTPAVPETGKYSVELICVEQPEEGSNALCNHWDEFLYLIMGVAYMLEDDTETQGQASRWFDLYFKSIALDREIDRDIFLQEMRFGARS